jgi:hypothetical protein
VSNTCIYLLENLPIRVHFRKPAKWTINPVFIIDYMTCCSCNGLKFLQKGQVMMNGIIQIMIAGGS